jgi:hypothetical protein
MPEETKFKSASEQLDGLRNFIGVMIQDALVTIQSGTYGPPTLEELERCGEYHALLEKLP